MYAYIKGTLEFTTLTEAIVEAGGVGYRIHISPKTKSRLPDVGKEVKLYTHFAVREDAMELYGFSSAEELFTYEQVISVSGVGPKVGLAIMSAMEPNQFVAAVIAGDVKAITAAQGVGAKLAARIILELKDKIKPFDYIIPNDNLFDALQENSKALEDALIVLTNFLIL